MKQDKMVNYQKNRKKILENETLAAIRKMAARGEDITFYSVAKTTKRSSKYLYSNPKIRAEIESHRKNTTPISEATAKAESTILRIECKRLKKQLEKLEEEYGESWKQKYLDEHEKYLKMYHECQELKKQLKCIYSTQNTSSSKT